MSIFAKIGNAFRAKSEGISWVDQMKFFRDGGKDDGSGSFEKLSTEQQLKVMRNNALVYACITTKARAFAQPPLALNTYNQADDTWATTDTSELLDPFQKNPELSESEIMQYIAMHLDLTGKAYLWKWKSADSMTREIWPVIPSWVKIVLVDANLRGGDERIISHFVITPDGQHGKEYIVPVEDMIYIRYPDPCNLWDGLSPIMAASRNIQLDNKASEYKSDAINNLNLPGVAIKTRKPLNQRQKDDLRAVLKQKMGGSARQNALLISGDDATIELLNPMKDFEWQNFSNMNETRICMVFGVPPIVVGSLVGIENSPWSNTGEAKRWMYQNTLAGLWRMVSGALTRSMIPDAYRDVLEYAFDLSEIKELRDDIDAVATRATALFEAGIITRNEAREMIDFEGGDGGDVFKYSMATILLTEDETGQTDLELSPEEQAAGVAEMSE